MTATRISTDEASAQKGRARGGVRARLGGDAAPSARLGIGLTVPFYALMGVLVIYPVIKLILLANASPGIGANLSTWAKLSANITAMRVTLLDSLIVTVIALAMGAVVAWSLVTTRRNSVRVILWITIIVPLAMNTILKAFAFTVLLQQHGVVNQLLIDLHIIHSPLSLLYNQVAAMSGMVYWLFPYAALPLYITFLTIDQDLLMVAEGLGATRTRALRDVVFRLALPGVFAAGVINYVLALGFFVIPILIGGISTPFASTYIYQDVTDFYNITGAAVSSLVLLVAAFVVLGAGYATIGRDRLLKAMA